MDTDFELGRQKRKKNGIKQQSLIKILRWTLNLNWSDQKLKQRIDLTKNSFVDWSFLFCCSNVSEFSKPLFAFFLDLFKLWRVELYRNDLKRNKNYWELLRFRVAEGRSTVKAWRKSSGNWLWFKLVRVQVIRSRLKLFQGYMLLVQGEVKRASLAAFVVSLQGPHLLQI